MRRSIDARDELSPTPVKAGDDGRMPLPGHYAGQTSQDGTISFDVSPRGWHVSNLMLTVTARRPHGGRAVIDLPVAVGRIIPVGPGGRWRARVSGEGVTVDYRGLPQRVGDQGRPSGRHRLGRRGAVNGLPHLVCAASRVTAALAAQGLLRDGAAASRDRTKEGSDA